MNIFIFISLQMLEYITEIFRGFDERHCELQSCKIAKKKNDEAVIYLDC